MYKWIDVGDKKFPRVGYSISVLSIFIPRGAKDQRNVTVTSTSGRSAGNISQLHIPFKLPGHCLAAGRLGRISNGQQTRSKRLERLYNPVSL